MLCKRMSCDYFGILSGALQLLGCILTSLSTYLTMCYLFYVYGSAVACIVMTIHDTMIVFCKPNNYLCYIGETGGPSSRGKARVKLYLHSLLPELLPVYWQAVWAYSRAVTVRVYRNNATVGLIVQVLLCTIVLLIDNTLFTSHMLLYQTCFCTDCLEE